MRSIDDHDAAASQSGDDGHLPQRPAHVERPGMDALFDRLFDTQSATTTRDLRFTLEHVNGAEIERRLRPLGIQKPRITGRKRLVKGRSAQAFAAASSCALSSFFRIFPVAPLGSVSTNCTVRGYL